MRYYPDNNRAGAQMLDIFELRQRHIERPIVN
jgi:hypothetical protein